MTKPQFTTEQIATLLDGLGVVEVVELPSYIDQNFMVTTTTGQLVCKVGNSDESLEQLQLENRAMHHLDGKVAAPRPIIFNAQEIFEHEGHLVRLVSVVEGDLISSFDNMPFSLSSFGRFVGDLVLQMRDFDHEFNRDLRWDLLRSSLLIEEYLPSVSDVHRPLIWGMYARLQVHWDTITKLPKSVVHNDLNDNNVFYNRSTQSFGLVDFGDMVHSLRISELVIALTYVMMGQDDPLDILREMVRGYYSVIDISNAELRYLLLLIATRCCVSICISSHDSKDNPDPYVTISQKPAVELLRWLSVLDETTFFDPLNWKNLEIDDSVQRRPDLLEQRQSVTSTALSLHYDTPLTIVRGRMQYLYDGEGKAYLDLVNNVPIVGHANPRVAGAIAQQASLLNTNSRYLHQLWVDYFELLRTTLPSKFTKIFYVNSGTEANELAIRLSRAYTGSKNMAVVEYGYHGNSNATVEISPYKFLGKGGSGQPDHVTVLPQGLSEEDLGTVRQRLDDVQLVSFLFEPVMGVAGQYYFDPSYLREICRIIRAKGGLCIADEVQIGFGRLGKNFWGFELMELEEYVDVIVLGKPMGNGFPVSAVVTTDAVVEKFETGMEFFSTFGGNALSLAAAHATLQEILNRNLQEHAKRLGLVMVKRMSELVTAFNTVRSAWGHGLFLGLEFDSGETAKLVINAMVDRGVLLGTDGPDNNILKIKPPLVITEEDIDYFITQVHSVLSTVDTG
ncbi:MAG: aminotransferase class III-fold pyridoxal phosphate-dependent enzyme [Candidatus Kariarchaeaceae archaeon]